MIRSNYLDRSIIKKEIKKLNLKHDTGAWLLFLLLLLLLCSFSWHQLTRELHCTRVGNYPPLS